MLRLLLLSGFVWASNAVCKSWCPSKKESWAEKCLWQSCTSCPECSGGPGCKGWCAREKSSWTKKCSWKDCSSCAECSGVTQPQPNQSQGCKGRCTRDKLSPWTKKCTFKDCSSCAECSGVTQPRTTQSRVAGCKGWCTRTTSPWSNKCTFKDCSSCRECSGGTQPRTIQSQGCKGWCTRDKSPWTKKCSWKDCSSCAECSAVTTTKRRNPVTTTKRRKHAAVTTTMTTNKRHKPLTRTTTINKMFLALYPSCNSHWRCKKNKMFCGTQCWTGDCGADGRAPHGTVRQFCQPCDECQSKYDSVTGSCNMCNFEERKPAAITTTTKFLAVYPSCTAHFNCGRSQFCGTQCWTGDCGFDRSVSANALGNYCQPCNKCQNGALDSVTGNCNFCNFGEAPICTSHFNCGRHGYCVKGNCVCRDSYTGELCEVPPEPVLCTSDADCARGSYCTSKKVCTVFFKDYCDTNSCGLGDADCDWDDKVGCDAGLTCGRDNCAQFHEIGASTGFNPSSDCCEGVSLTTATTGVPTRIAKDQACINGCVNQAKHHGWTTVCVFTPCSGCSQCLTTTTKIPGCHSSCVSKKQRWAKKCSWKECSGCSQCTNSVSVSAPNQIAECQSSCASKQQIWAKKCSWRRCSGCSQCAKIVPPPTATTAVPTTSVPTENSAVPSPTATTAVRAPPATTAVTTPPVPTGSRECQDDCADQTRYLSWEILCRFSWKDCGGCPQCPSTLQAKQERLPTERQFDMLVESVEDKSDRFSLSFIITITIITRWLSIL